MSSKSMKISKNKNCILKTYGKGFLLVPEEGHPDWGTKYYNNGWWMPKHNAWFFKKEYKEVLNKLICKKHKKSNKTSDKYKITFKQYGKGFLLVPEEGHPDWGIKYYHNGWWMPKHNAWFFKKEYKEFLEKFCKDDSNVNEHYENNSTLNFKPHGRGFLLVPEEGHPDWGNKYYHNGWWMPKYNAWFFKKTDKESFVKSNSQMKTVKKHKKSDLKKSNNMLVKAYGKGFLLVPEEGHPDWGTKYYHNGWWMPKHNAWFFKKEYKDFLMKYTEKENKDDLFKGFKLKKYGKGYMLTVNKDHPDWGEKYYYNGWWFSKHNAWFFKKEWKSFLIENGAKMSKKTYQDDKNTFHGFKMESYGKGLLLKPPSSNHCNWGEKYYFGGWWFPKQNGWFFKKEFESFLKENGAN